MVKPKFFRFEIFRKRQQHDIPETKKCDTKFIRQASICNSFSSFIMLKADVGFIANSAQKVHDFL